MKVIEWAWESRWRSFSLPIDPGKMKPSLRVGKFLDQMVLYSRFCLAHFVILSSNNYLAQSKHSTNSCFRKSSIPWVFTLVLVFFFFFREHFQFATQPIKSLSLQSHREIRKQTKWQKLACEVKTVLSPMSCARQFCTWMPSPAKSGSLTASWSLNPIWMLLTDINGAPQFT